MEDKIMRKFIDIIDGLFTGINRMLKLFVIGIIVIFILANSPMLLIIIPLGIWLCGKW